MISLTLLSHTHWQVAQGYHASQNFDNEKSKVNYKNIWLG
jgi:hypothetical protein